MSGRGAPSGRVTFPEPATLRLERLLPGPVERVWAFLVEPERRGLWLAGGPLEPRVGGRVELRFRHADLSPREEATPERFRKYDDGATVHGRVTRWEPPRRLAYTWGEEDGAETEVTFELEPVEEKTEKETENETEGEPGRVRLVLTHRRLGEHELRVGVAAGWHTHVDILAERLAGHEPAPFWGLFEELEGLYREELGKERAEG